MNAFTNSLFSVKDNIKLVFSPIESNLYLLIISNVGDNI